MKITSGLQYTRVARYEHDKQSVIIIDIICQIQELRTSSFSFTSPKTVRNRNDVKKKKPT